MKNLGPCHRAERRVHTKKGKDVLIVEGRKRRSTSVHEGPVEERIHLSFQVTPNITSTFCGKKGQNTEDGAELLTHKSVDNKKQVSFTPHRRHTRWSRKEKSVYKAGPKMGI